MSLIANLVYLLISLCCATPSAVLLFYVSHSLNTNTIIVSHCCAVCLFELDSPNAILFSACVQFWCFMWNGLDLPIGIDGHADWHTPPLLTSSTLLHNTLLLLIFPIQHT